MALLIIGGLAFVALLIWIAIPPKVQELPPVESPPLQPQQVQKSHPLSVAEAAASLFPDQIAQPDALFPNKARLRAIKAALRNGWAVELIYHDTNGFRTTRVIEPLYLRGDNHVRAFCRLRQEKRTFRLDRIEALRVQAATRAAQQRYQIGRPY